MKFRVFYYSDKLDFSLSLSLAHTHTHTSRAHELMNKLCATWTRRCVSCYHRSRVDMTLVFTTTSLTATHRPSCCFTAIKAIKMQQSIQIARDSSFDLRCMPMFISAYFYILISWHQRCVTDARDMPTGRIAQS